MLNSKQAALIVHMQSMGVLDVSPTTVDPEQLFPGNDKDAKAFRRTFKSLSKFDLATQLDATNWEVDAIRLEDALRDYRLKT